MSATTVERTKNAAPRKAKINRWDSPWLNPKFIAGFGMVLFVALMGVVGPLFWDVNLARVATSPQNLPPPWAPGYDYGVEEVVVEIAAPVAAVSDEPAKAAPSLTGGNPLAPSTSSGSTSVTGGNPLAPKPTASGSLTGGNPLAPSSSSSGGSSMTGGNPLAPASAAQSEPAQAAAPVVTTRRITTNAYGFGLPAWEHPFGTESNGRDMLAVLLVGAPRSLRIGLIAAGLGMLVGIFLGFTAGFMGGWVDNVIRTLSDAVITIPSLAVLIVISAYVRSVSVENMALLLALFAWPGPTRLIRAQVLTMRERGYVQMARLSGASRFDIMFREMMPNLMPYLASSFTGNVSGAILAATGLEALGLGPTRIPTLGMTIFYAIRAAAILRGMWWWWGLPIAILVIIFSGLFLMTIGLDEIANPRLRGVKQ